ncbi:MAG TPA: hypothetical protein PKE49_04535 [Leptospiraceae bacterium]|nr:hypothetical protein [Leptospirales bacterium]HMU81972.1 hypothetical protein [Leptospiraceae bacterium]HMW58349.1 hypothetical protein [Leptospiraceae bacterium]HMX55765.1 hypothetical protein [Leptospiraceae bacterium]HMY45856.1 hypothetical protein [Leptospiraceae bacterium]
MKPKFKWCLGLLCLLALGCQKSKGDSSLSRLLMLSAAGSTIVRPASGATIQAPTMSLTVPQGALEEETTITYEPIDVPAGTDTIQPLQAAYKFGPENLQFSKPATLQICYDARNVNERGLQEKTMQIQYFDEESGQFVSMGGEVDQASHCVSAPIYHFSSYILTAQLLSAGNNAPTIGGAQFFPGRVMAGQPVTVRSTVTDWDGGSGIATVRFFYRTTGSGAAFKSVVMIPDSNDGSGQFYTAKVPGADVTSAGLQYYIQAFDTLNAGRTNPATAPVALGTVPGDTVFAAAPIRFQTPVSQISAGFSRDLTVQVRGNASATYYPVAAETLTFAGAKGTTARPTWLSARYTAQKIGSSFLEATYGTLNLSVPINVYPGVLSRIEVLYNDAVLSDPFNVNAGTVKQLDAAGYDSFDNFMFVQPVFSVAGGIGSFGGPANYGQFTAAPLPADTTGTITATLGGGFSVTYNVLVHGSGASCQFDVGHFDTSCVFN